MTFAFSLGTLMGIPGCRRFADHGVRALSRVMRDHEHGGWYSAVGHELDAEGHGVPVDAQARKECYQHAFVDFSFFSIKRNFQAKKEESIAIVIATPSVSKV